MRAGQRTVLAQKALDASDVIHMTFAKRRIGHTLRRKVEVKVPDGPSTDGGRKARQSITLTPENGEGATLMCGWLDLGRQQAELRAFPVVAAQHESRFGQALDFDASEYDALIQDLARTLRNLQVNATISDVIAGPGPMHGVAASSNRALLWATVGAAVGLGSAALFFLLG